MIRRRCKCGCKRITNHGNKWISGHNPSWNKGTAILKIRRKCKCGCERITNYGKIWIRGHCSSSGNKDKKHSEETKKKMSLSHSGYKFSKEAKLKMSLSSIKYDPNYEYCDVWKDKEYKKDIRKNYCENKNCKDKSKRLNNHHIYLDKKRCAPDEIMTLCANCHSFLHRKLQLRKKIAANQQDFIIINRPNHISYIHKQTRKIIIIKRKEGYQS